jgi:hypothetical protein
MQIEWIDMEKIQSSWEILLGVPRLTQEDNIKTDLLGIIIFYIFKDSEETYLLKYCLCSK